MLILSHSCILTHARVHTLTLTFTLPHDHASKCTQIYKHTHTQPLPCNHAHSCSHTRFYPHTQSLLCTHAHSHTLSHTITLTLIVTPSRNHTLTLTVKLVHPHSPTHTYSQAWSPNSDPHCTSICGLARTDLTANQPTPGHRCHSWQPFKPLSSLASEQRTQGSCPWPDSGPQPVCLKTECLPALSPQTLP
jgi:hypothetical protein